MAINNPTGLPTSASPVNLGTLLGLCETWDVRAEEMRERAAVLARNRCPGTGSMMRTRAEEREACAHELRTFTTGAYDGARMWIEYRPSVHGRLRYVLGGLNGAFLEAGVHRLAGTRRKGRPRIMLATRPLVLYQCRLCARASQEGGGSGHQHGEGRDTHMNIGGVCLVCVAMAGCTTTGSLVAKSPAEGPGIVGEDHQLDELAPGPAAVQPDSTCDSLDGKRRTWGALSAGGAVATGGGGVGTSVFDDKTPRLVTGLTTLAVGIFAGVAAYLAGDYGTSYRDRGCVTPKED